MILACILYNKMNCFISLVLSVILASVSCDILSDIQKILDIQQNLEELKTFSERKKKNEIVLPKTIGTHLGEMK